MKILCSFLLMAGFVVCKGQGVVVTPGTGIRVVLWRLEGSQGVGSDMVKGFVGGFSGWKEGFERRAFVLTGGDSVRVMRPDRMVCLVPDVAKVERMPVKRVYNGDRMVVRMGESWRGKGQLR